MKTLTNLIKTGRLSTRTLGLGALLLTLTVFVWAPTIAAQPSSGYDGPPQMSDPGMDGPDGQRPFRRWRDNRNQQQIQGPGPQQGQGPGNRLAKMSRFLEFANKYHQSIQEPYDAFGLAVMGIVEHYKKAKHPEKAVLELEQLLGETTDAKARNIILFQLRQLYQAERKPDEMLKITRQIARENLTAIQNGKGTN